MSNKKYKGLTLRIRGFRDDLYAFIDVDTEINHKYYLQNYECFDQIIKDTITRNLSFVINKSGMRCKPDPQNIKEIGFWINNIGIGDRKIFIKYIDHNGWEGFTSLSYECN